MSHLHNLNTLLGNKRINDGHPLKKLPEDDMAILDKAIGIANEKYQENGKSVNDLRGRLCDPKSYHGLLGELFWCHRLPQLGYSFQMEGEDGGGDFRIVLDNRTIFAEVKTLQKLIGTKKDSDLSFRLDKAIRTHTDNHPSAFYISVTLRRAFTDKTIKPLLREIKNILEQINLYQREYTFSYPKDSDETWNCQAKVIIKQIKAEKSIILINRGASLSADDTLLRNNLNKANKQLKLKKNDVNVVFVDRTWHSIDEEDIDDALFGKSVCDVRFDEISGEVNSIDPDRLGNGFFRDGSSISAVIVYCRNSMSGIRDSVIYCHPNPKYCEFTESEQRHLDELFKS